MSNYQMENEEVILYQGNVFLNEKTDVKFTLTTKKIIFEKEKGIFKKKLKVIDMIELEKIKVYKDNVMIKQNKTSLTIQTIDKDITFNCKNVLETVKIMEEIIKTKTGTNKLERGKKKLDNLANIAKQGVEIVGIVATIAIDIKKIYDDYKRKK